MLRPAQLTAAQLGIAVKPAVGYESKFSVCPLPYTEVGELQLMGANSGVWTASPEIASWTSAQHVVAVLDNGVNSVANIVVTFGAGNTATFAPVSHATMTRNIFPAGAAQEVKNAGDTAYTNPGTAPTVVCNADAAGCKIKFFALSNIDTFITAPCKVSIAYPIPSAMPTSIQCGRDKSAFVKDGEIPEKTFRLTAKITVEGDVLTRIAGQRVIGLIKETKEDKVTVMHTFFMGLIITPERNNGESMEPDTLQFTGQYEDLAMIWAAGP